MLEDQFYKELELVVMENKNLKQQNKKLRLWSCIETVICIICAGISAYLSFFN